MKLAVLADVHGNLAALTLALDHIDAAEPDQIWVLGDLAAHGPRPAECVALLRERHEADKDRFKVIGGNTDRYLLTNARPRRKPAEDEAAYQQANAEFAALDGLFSWARGLLGWENYDFLRQINGKELAHTVPGYGIVMGYHAIPGDDETNITDDTPDEAALDSVLDRPLRLGLYGHIHRQVNRDLGRVRLVNPGSVGLSFDAPGKVQFAMLRFDEGVFSIDHHALDYDTAAVIEDARAVGHPAPDLLAKLLTEGI